MGLVCVIACFRYFVAKAKRWRRKDATLRLFVTSWQSRKDANLRLFVISWRSRKDAILRLFVILERSRKDANLRLFVISCQSRKDAILRLFAFVFSPSPRNNEITKWHKSATMAICNLVFALLSKLFRHAGCSEKLSKTEIRRKVTPDAMWEVTLVQECLPCRWNVFNVYTKM